MKKLGVSVLLMLACSTVYAQGAFLNDYRAPGKPLLVNQSGVINGSPYLSEEWGRGIVYVNDRVKSDVVFIRYDILNQMAEMKDASGNAFALDPSKIRKFELTIIDGQVSRKYILENGFVIDGFSRNEYFERVWEGKNKYLRHYQKELLNDPSSYGATKSKTLADQLSYVVIKSNGEVVTFKENKKSLLKAFASIEKEIADYMKARDIKITDHEKMHTLFEFIDSLSEQ